MHRTHSLDYGLILRGRVDLELDGGEVLHLHSGDVIVQRGTNHLWFDPSHTEWTRVAFVLLDALPVSANGTVLEGLICRGLRPTAPALSSRSKFQTRDRSRR